MQILVSFLIVLFALVKICILQTANISTQNTRYCNSESLAHARTVSCEPLEDPGKLLDTRQCVCIKTCLIATLQCKKSGNWSFVDNSRKCRRNTTEIYEKDSNFLINYISDYNYNISCNNGYNLKNENETLKCMNGNWSGNWPKCVANANEKLINAAPNYEDEDKEKEDNSSSRYILIGTVIGLIIFIISISLLIYYYKVNKKDATAQVNATCNDDIAIQNNIEVENELYLPTLECQGINLNNINNDELLDEYEYIP